MHRTTLRSSILVDSRRRSAVGAARAAVGVVLTLVAFATETSADEATDFDCARNALFIFLSVSARPVKLDQISHELRAAPGRVLNGRALGGFEPPRARG